MKIDKKLNVVLPLERPDGMIYVHSTPIARAVFERFFLVISKTFAAIYSEGLGSLAGPRVAAMMVRKVAAESGILDEVERGFFAELRRLSNVLMLTGDGWEAVPLHNAITNGVFSDDELSEVENALTFFTVVSAMHKRTEVGQVLGVMSSLWGAQITSSNCTEYGTSLQTSTGAASSGVTATT
jgi:hypothetical protein